MVRLRKNTLFADNITPLTEEEIYFSSIIAIGSDDRSAFIPYLGDDACNYLDIDIYLLAASDFE